MFGKEISVYLGKVSRWRRKDGEALVSCCYQNRGESLVSCSSDGGLGKLANTKHRQLWWSLVHGGRPPKNKVRKKMVKVKLSLKVLQWRKLWTEVEDCCAEDEKSSLRVYFGKKYQRFQTKDEKYFALKVEYKSNTMDDGRKEIKRAPRFDIIANIMNICESWNMENSDVKTFTIFFTQPIFFFSKLCLDLNITYAHTIFSFKHFSLKKINKISQHLFLATLSIFYAP